FRAFGVVSELDRDARRDRVDDRGVDDLLEHDDLLVNTGEGEVADRPIDGELHLLDEAAAHAEVHRDAAAHSLLAAGPLLELLRVGPPGEDDGARSVEEADDAGSVHFGSFCSFASRASSVSKLKFQPAATW